MAIRISKVTRELNVGASTLVEFLHKKGFGDVTEDLNQKLTDEQYNLLVAEFSQDKSHHDLLFRIQFPEFLRKRTYLFHTGRILSVHICCIAHNHNIHLFLAEIISQKSRQLMCCNRLQPARNNPQRISNSNSGTLGTEINSQNPTQSYFL